jgi:hypothetical protein
VHRGLLEPLDLGQPGHLAAERGDEGVVPVRAAKGYDGKGDVRASALRIMHRTRLGRERRLWHRATHDGTIEPVAGWSEAEAVRAKIDPDGPDQRTRILWVGDHDPSGLDLKRDIAAKLDLYGAAGLYDIERVAVTCEETCQSVAPELHSNPAKEKDPRWRSYVAEGHTDQSWEVESIEPAVLAERVTAAIKARINLDQWAADAAAEESDLGRLRTLAEDFDATDDGAPGE